MGVHVLNSRYLEDTVNVALVGCGGNGSQMLTGLARLDRAMRALGHPGFHVTAFDPDTVTEANVGRQLFSPADVGLNKATVLMHRVNSWFGLGWSALPIRWEDSHGHRLDLVVSCVDTRATRVEIDKKRGGFGARYWLDLGNRESDGQVVLGEWPGFPATIHKSRAMGVTTYDAATAQVVQRLPTVLDIFPEIRTDHDTDDTAPSCSLAEALERQELFVNQAVATWALALLWSLFRFGRIAWHGAFVNLQSGRVTTLPVDPEAWGRMGVNQRRRSK